MKINEKELSYIINPLYLNLIIYNYLNEIKISIKQKDKILLVKNHLLSLTLLFHIQLKKLEKYL